MISRFLIVAVSLTAWSAQAAADDWAAPVMAQQRALSDAGINLGAGITQFGQGIASGDGNPGFPLGGKVDVRLGLNGAQFGLWTGFSVSAHFEQLYGHSANEQGDGSIIPVNAALAFPQLGGTSTDLSLTVSQDLGSHVSVTVGKFNMYDAVASNPLIGGGGETTFWNLGLAVPISGVTPPYIIGGLLSVKTELANFSFRIYDPRDAQDLDVIRQPFAQGATFSLSTTIPLTLAGRSGFHTIRGVYSSAKGLNLEDIPQLLLPPGSAQVTGQKKGYYFGSYAFQQYIWQDSEQPTRGWGVFGQIALSDGNPNPVRASAILGIGGSAPFQGRSDDRWGIAWFYYKFSQHLKDGLSTIGEGLNDERGVEAYYDAGLVNHIRLGPDAQAIWPGTPGKPTVIFLGARGSLTF